jgi:hypothetical protein
MDEINHPILKAGVASTAWISLTWIDWLTDAGKVAAALTAIVIFSELLWKKVIRPIWRYFKE